MSLKQLKSLQQFQEDDYLLISRYKQGLEKKEDTPVQQNTQSRMTKDQIIESLTELSIDFDKNAKKDELMELLKKATEGE